MSILFDILKAIVLEPRNGIIVLLAVLLCVALWAFWQERKRNNEIQDERVVEAREDTALMTNALNEATQAAIEFKDSNDALRLAFDALTRAI